MHALIIEDDDDLIAIAIEEALRECGFHFVSFRSVVRRGRRGGSGKVPAFDHRRRGIETWFRNRRSPNHLLRQSDPRHLHHRATGRGALTNASPSRPEQTVPKQRS